MAITEALRLLVTADTQGAVQGIEKLGATSERELGRSTKTIDKWGHGLTKAGAGMIAFGGVAVAGLLSAGNAASDLNEVASKSATVFGAASKKVDEFASSAAEIGLSKKAALEAASGFGNMFDQLGVASDKAAEMSIEVTKLAADFASFHNADITEVLEAQSAAFRGEFDSIQKFLPLLSAATVEQRAMALTGKENADELTAQDKALAVHKLMLEGAGQAQGDFARTSDSAANQQRILAAEFENMKASLGQGVLPVMKTGLGILNDLVGAFSDMNAVTDGTVGKVATFGSVALIAAGGASVLIGQIIKARENFSAAWDAVGGLTDRLGGFKSAAILGGSAVAVLITGFALWQDQVSENRAEQERLREALRDTEGAIKGVTRELVVDAFRPWIRGLNDAGVSVGVLTDALDGNKDAIEQVKRASFEMGGAGIGLRRQLESGTEAIGKQRDALKEESEFTDDATAKTEDLSTATDGSAESFDKASKAVEEAKKALDALNDELDAMLSQFLSVDQAIAKQNQGFLEVDAHLKEMREEYGRNAFALDVTTEAGIANTEMLDGLVESAAGVIEKMREEGATEEAIQAQWEQSKGQLQGVLQQFRDNGVEVGKYDRLLRGVDAHVVTTVEARGLAATMGQLGELKRKYDGAEYRVRVDVAATQRGGINIGSGVRVFHEGGVVPGRRGEEVAAVLQAGEEVLALNDPRNMANARHMAPAFAGAAASSGVATAMVVIDVTGGDDQFMRWLRDRVRVEGGGSAQVALGRGTG